MDETLECLISGYWKGKSEDLLKEIYDHLSQHEAEDLDSLVTEFRTVQGLVLPMSKGRKILVALKEFLDKFLEWPKTDELSKSIVRNILNNDELKSIRRDILTEIVIEKRKSQLISLRQTEVQINLISDNNKPISIVNDVDLEEFPPNLTYINSYWPKLDEDEIGCECDSNEQCCSSSCTHFQNELAAVDINKAATVGRNRKPIKNTKNKKPYDPKSTRTMPYDDQGRIIDNKLYRVIYECNKFCKCDDSCRRKNVQKGGNFALEIFRTFNDCGWGVRTLENIPKGAFVCKYSGEMMLFDKANEKDCKEYLFDIDLIKDEESGHCEYTVDSFEYGNISRFVNHNCDHNLEIHVVFIENAHPGKGEIAFFANRDIEANEELTITYKNLVEAKYGPGSCRCYVCMEKKLT